MRKVEVPFLRTAFNYDRNLASDESGIDCQYAVDRETGERVATPSMAKQSFADECDINTIVRRFNLTGELPTNVRAPTYADFADVPDFHAAMNAIRAAEESFMEMPAEVRARFGNDPGAFVEFCSDDRNRPEAERLGLVLPPEPEVDPLLPAKPPKASEGVSAPPEAPQGPKP